MVLTCARCLCGSRRPAEKGTTKRRRPIGEIIPTIIAAMNERSDIQLSALKEAEGHRTGWLEQQRAAPHARTGVMYHFSDKVCSVVLEFVLTTSATHVLWIACLKAPTVDVPYLPRR